MSGTTAFIFALFVIVAVVASVMYGRAALLLTPVAVTIAIWRGWEDAKMTTFGASIALIPSWSRAKEQEPTQPTRKRVDRSR